MTICTVAKGVRYVPGPWFMLKPSERTQKLFDTSESVFREIQNEADEKFGENFTDQERIKWIKEQLRDRDPLYNGHWSDNKDHDTFYFYGRYRKDVDGRNKRYRKYQELAKQYFGDCIQCGYGKYDHRKYLVLDEVFYRQGWFFTKKLFDVQNSIFYAFDKESAKKLVKNLVDTSKEYGQDAYDDVMQRIDEFKDNEKFVLRIAW